MFPVLGYFSDFADEGEGHFFLFGDCYTCNDGIDG